ncbi:hypothetical protein ASG66_17075 [Bacillus sp. Leaf406]|nr:hypothetical protein ASG66_17075 [Bacillus sp. Leaf406]
MNYTIGLIDDEAANVRTVQRKARLTSVTVEPIELEEDMGEVIKKILESNIQGILVDYKLNLTKPNIRYNGADLINELEKHKMNFPSFILTGFEDDAENELIDVNKIYRKEDYFHDPAKLNRRIIKQIENHKEKIKNAEQELYLLLEKKAIGELSLKEEERLIELDNFIENCISSKGAIAVDLKKTSNSDRLDTLLNKANKILEEVRKYEKI